MISNSNNSGCICFQNCNDWQDYTIQEKDTLYNISVKFGIPIRMLMSCNKMVNPYNLQVGQIIKVPGSKSQAVGCREGQEETYTIELKDTLYNISERLEISVEELIKMNPGIDPYNLKQGTKICIPKKNISNNNTEQTTPINPPQPAPINPPHSVNMISPQPAPISPLQQAHMSSPHSAHINLPQPAPMNSSKPMQHSQSNQMTPPIIQPRNNDGMQRRTNITTEKISENMNSDKKNYQPIHSTNTMNSVDSGDSVQINSNSTRIAADIPSLSPSDEPCTGRSYVTQPGDTLETILNNVDLTYASVAFANPTVDFYDLMPGTRLCIPVNDMFRNCNSGTTYIIKNGDSLSTLSQRFDVSESSILAANPFAKISDFSIAGLKVCIPD